MAGYSVHEIHKQIRELISNIVSAVQLGVVLNASVTIKSVSFFDSLTFAAIRSNVSVPHDINGSYENLFNRMPESTRDDVCWVRLFRLG